MSTRPVSQKDQDCISVLLSLKNPDGASPPTMTSDDLKSKPIKSVKHTDANIKTNTTTIKANANSKTSARLDHPCIEQSESSETMSTAATVSTANSSSCTYSGIGVGPNSNSNSNSKTFMNIPEPLYREETISPNAISLCHASAATYFPHMHMVQQQQQQQMNMNYGGHNNNTHGHGPSPGQMRHPGYGRGHNNHGHGHGHSAMMNRNHSLSASNFNPMYNPHARKSWSPTNATAPHTHPLSDYELAPLARRSESNPSHSRHSANGDGNGSGTTNGIGNNGNNGIGNTTFAKGRSRRNKAKFNNNNGMQSNSNSNNTSSPVDTDIHSKIDPTLQIQSEIDLEDKKTLEKLVGDSDLVDVEDRQYIPDYIFLSMAQLKSCLVTPLDRIGTYKSREIGFQGMACKHCGGEPGFGRYFPETLRSLSQTTTSQTIVKHIAYKCRKCPKDIKNSVRALKELQDTKDLMAKEYHRSRFEERPKYGSRKVFFQRFWARLHEQDTVDSDSSAAGKKKSGSSSKGNNSVKGKNEGKEDEKKRPSARNSNIESNDKSPGRQRLVSYEDSEGENVPPGEEE